MQPAIMCAMRMKLAPAAVCLALPAAAVAQRVSTTAGLIDAAGRATAGTVIDVAPGTYTLDSSLKLGAGVTLRGAGAGQTVIRSADAWRADFTARPEELDFRRARPENYLIDLGNDATNAAVRNLTLTGPTIYGGVYGNSPDGLVLSGLELRGFGWSGVRLFRTENATITNNTFVDAGNRINGRSGGQMFLTYQSSTPKLPTTGSPAPTAATSTASRAGSSATTRIHHNTINPTFFAVELPFENDVGVEIDHNYLAGGVSVPKFAGGPTEIDGQRRSASATRSASTTTTSPAPTASKGRATGWRSITTCSTSTPATTAGTSSPPSAAASTA